MDVLRSQHLRVVPSSCHDDAPGRVVAALLAKWDEELVGDDPLAPWMPANEVAAVAGLALPQARRILKDLAARHEEVLYEPADRVRQQPAKWVHLKDVDKTLGLPVSARPDLPCTVTHITAEHWCL